MAALGRLVGGALLAISRTAFIRVGTWHLQMPIRSCRTEHMFGHA